MPVDIISIILTVTGVLLLALGTVILIADWKNRANLMFALFCIGLSVWTLMIIGFLATNQYNAAILWMKGSYVVAFFCGVTFWCFAKTLTGVTIYRRSSIILHTVLLILFGAMILGTDLIVKWWHYLPDGSKEVTVSTFGWSVFAVYFLAYFAVGNLMLLKKYWNSGGKLRKQMLVMVFGVFVGGEIFGVFFNLILPSPIFNEWHYVWTGPFLTAVFMVPFITYGIFKYELLNVKIIATETLVLALTLFTLLEFFAADSVGEYLFRSLVFLGVIVFGILLIRSVLQEVRRREEVQRLALKLKATNRRLRQLDDLKTTMVSIASHQLRGPLGGIRGYLTMFRDGDLGHLTDKQKEIVKMNLNTLTRLMNAVETFLDITKLEVGKMVLRKEVLPLDDAVRDVAHEFEIMLRRKGLKLVTDIEQHVWVEFDPEKIKHVIFNLIDNAMKYSEEGTITVKLKKEAQEAVITITDTGKGMKPEEVPRLFGKYERGELVVDRGGSGLGLYVVKMLIEMQGGAVSASSPGPDKGSTFTVKLPLAKSQHG